VKKKIALITGITGQDGSYLAEFLLNKNYIVHGIKRKSSSFNTNRIDHLLTNKKFKDSLKIHYGDLADFDSLLKIISFVKPLEIYNLASQTHVGASFQLPEYTADINGLGTLRILEIIRILNLNCKFYQASSSELYGKTSKKSLSESTAFKPDSPYAISKLFSYWITRNYRDSYKIFASNGILFNHESCRRTPTFVTRKITRGLARVIYGLDTCIELGNLNSSRDWGHSKDYVEMQWKILQHKKPMDIVIATGKQYTVRKFVDLCCEYLGIKLKWSGKGINEVANIVLFKNKKLPSKLKKNQKIIKVNKKYFRPVDVDNLMGDSSKAKKILKWKPKYSIKDLIKEMLDHDLIEAKREFEQNKC
jgi:GDPmannose 4,6-dehydratase